MHRCSPGTPPPPRNRWSPPDPGAAAHPRAPRARPGSPPGRARGTPRRRGAAQRVSLRESARRLRAARAAGRAAAATAPSTAAAARADSTPADGSCAIPAPMPVDRPWASTSNLPSGAPARIAERGAGQDAQRGGGQRREARRGDDHRTDLPGAETDRCERQQVPAAVPDAGADHNEQFGEPDQGQHRDQSGDHAAGGGEAVGRVGHLADLQPVDGRGRLVAHGARVRAGPEDKVVEAGLQLRRAFAEGAQVGGDDPAAALRLDAAAHEVQDLRTPLDRHPGPVADLDAEQVQEPLAGHGLVRPRRARPSTTAKG